MDTPPLNVGALIELLEDLPANTPLRIANATSLPFECTLGEPVIVDLDDGTTVVYLTEHTRIGRLPGRAATALRWADEDRGMHR